MGLDRRLQGGVSVDVKRQMFLLTEFHVQIIYLLDKQNSFTRWFPYKILSTPILWTTVFNKLTVTQLVQKFPAFYGTRIFITVFTRASYSYLSWARWIQSTTSHTLSLRLILISSSHLRLCISSGLSTSGFQTISLCISPSCVLHAPSTPSSMIWSSQ